MIVAQLQLLYVCAIVESVRKTHNVTVDAGLGFDLLFDMLDEVVGIYIQGGDRVT